MSFHFEQFNRKMLQSTVLLTLIDYVALSHSIPIHLPVPYRMSDISSLLHFLISIANISPHSCDIPFSHIEKFGFEIKDTAKNRFKAMFGIPRYFLDNELAFLKRNRLIADIDYKLRTEILPESTEEIDIEYQITPIAFYKLLANRYDEVFMVILSQRSFQLITNYQNYLNMFHDSQVEDLRATNMGLMEDITQLSKEYPEIKNSQIFKTNRCQCDSNLRNSFVRTIQHGLNSTRRMSPSLIPSIINRNDIAMLDGALVSSNHSSIDDDDQSYSNYSEPHHGSYPPNDDFAHQSRISIEPSSFETIHKQSIINDRRSYDVDELSDSSSCISSCAKTSHLIDRQILNPDAHIAILQQQFTTELYGSPKRRSSRMIL